MTQQHSPKSTRDPGQVAPGRGSRRSAVPKSPTAAAALASSAHGGALARENREDRTTAEDIGYRAPIEVTPAESQRLREELDRYLQERYASSGRPSEQQRAQAHEHIEELRHEISKRSTT